MILIGQFDSPFVRRVGIALRLYDLPFEHRPWSTFGDADKIAPYNPLRRVPTLVLDDGEVLIESTAILDHLDETVGPSRAMIAENGPRRREALKVRALATGPVSDHHRVLGRRGLGGAHTGRAVERARLARVARADRGPGRACRRPGALRGATGGPGGLVRRRALS